MPVSGLPWTRTLQIMVLGVWLGSMIFFSSAVAPTTFALAGSREVAGQIVASLLKIVYIGGIVAATLSLLLEYIYAWANHRGMLKLVMLALMVALAATLFTYFFLVPQMEHLRQLAGGSLQALPADNPTRLLFERYHRWSVYLMLCTMLAVFAALLRALRRGGPG